ncbi:head-tail connector protein [Heyndrickxia acidicola]|uniref:Head-tail connector protein n=1 Tax=Heyndrickxia acidicola TaxID=209389 RepID=A0ABU6MQC8_9BACI|nr:head-tail connector protein [Heyndrickxia acidicola]MED1205843.1 head-tail connector protein [Heyndrickxia acidicola]
MTLQLNDIKTALRINTSVDDFMLLTFMQAASDYVKGAVGSEDNLPGFYDENPRFDTVVIMLTDHYYKYRTAVTDASNKMQVVEIPFGVKSLILQLKGSYAWQLQTQANSTS